MAHTPLMLAFTTVCALAPAALAQVQYRYDDGTGNTNVGFNQVADFLFGNVYQTQPGGEVITRISVAFGNIEDGTPVRLMLYDIADGSLNPLSGRKRVTVSGESRFRQTNTFVDFDIPPTRVSGSFFVGCATPVTSTGPRPARLDPQNAALSSRSFVFAATDFNDIEVLSAAPFSLSMNNNVVQGAIMVRATGRPADCLVDFDRDGFLSAADLWGFIAAFLEEPPRAGPGLGAAPCAEQLDPYQDVGFAADTNRDCFLDQEDLSTFITAYFSEVSHSVECRPAP